MKHPAMPALLLCAAATLAHDAIGDVLVVTSAKDNTLYQSALGDLSNGAGAHLFAGATGSFSLRRGLVAFDLSDIPGGSTIHEVELTLNLSRTSSPSAASVRLHRTLADWGEAGSVAPGEQGGGAPAAPGDATWLHTFHDTQFWTSPGGDFSSVISASRAIEDLGVYTWESTPELVADVQGWVDAPAGNFGWTLVGDESGPRTDKRFDTHEHTNPALRPALRVEFTPVPEPSTIILITAGALGLSRRRRAPAAARSRAAMGETT